MRKLLALSLLAAVAGLVTAQTNSVPTGGSQKIHVAAGRGYFDLNAGAVIYYNGVVVTNGQGRLTCERLTIRGVSTEHPTNAVAETNLDIIYVDSKGETNHLVADKGVYLYSAANGVTNETFTFTGHVTNTTARMWMTGEPMVWDNIHSNLDLGTNYQLQYLGGGSNGSPLNLMK